MLTVVTPAASTQLTTATAASTLLGIPPDTDGLNMAIEQASGMIVDHCRRPFGLEKLRETFQSPRSGLLLSRGPATAVASVDEGESTLDPDDYELDGETLWRVSNNCRLAWRGPIIVTYSAGYVLPGDPGSQTLPAPVERAAVLLVAAILSSRNRDPMIRSEAVEGIGSTSWWLPEGYLLPDPSAVTLLAPYCRIIGY